MAKQKATERILHVGEREIELICPICGGKRFYDRKTLMNTAGMTFLGYDWLNDEATNFVCADCSYIYWFMNDPTIMPEKPRELTPVQQYEEQFTDYPDATLYKICFGREYSEDKKKAARSILNRRGVKV